jgi:hypothetical protein
VSTPLLQGSGSVAGGGGAEREEQARAKVGDVDGVVVDGAVLGGAADAGPGVVAHGGGVDEELAARGEGQLVEEHAAGPSLVEGLAHALEERVRGVFGLHLLLDEVVRVALERGAAGRAFSFFLFGLAIVVVGIVGIALANLLFFVLSGPLVLF